MRDCRVMITSYVFNLVLGSCCCVLAQCDRSILWLSKRAVTSVHSYQWFYVAIGSPAY